MSEAAVETPAAASLRSGKGEKDENFPVASFLLRPEHRGPILAFYRFARTADDVSDHPTLPPHEKLAHLAAMRATLSGDSDADAEALALRKVCDEKRLTIKHGLDLLEAFRRDVTKLRYDSWDDLIDYCAVSAMPVGRFVLDVHGEERETTWRASDALCAALQVINHLQDCGKDRRTLDRVYIPADTLAAAGIGVEALDAPSASPALRAVIAELAERTEELLFRSRPFATLISDPRLAYEVAVIQRLAEDLNERLLKRDPLSQRVHHRPWEALALAALAAVDRLGGRR